MSNSRPNGTNGSSAVEVATNQVRQRSMAYPRYSLRQAEELALIVFKEGATRCDQDNIARKAGYTGADNGSFKSLRASAKYFGLVDYEPGDCISVTDEWIDVFHREDPERAKRARQEAMRRPPLYRMLFDEYGNSQLPPREKLARELHLREKYGIVKEAAKRAAEAFIDSASYAGMVDERNRLHVNPLPENAYSPVDDEESPFSDSMPEFVGQVGSQGGRPQQQQVIRGGDSNYQTVAIPAELERHEVQLRNGKKAYLFIPVPLPAKERQRLQQYIGLILDEDDVEPQGPSARQQMIEWEEAS